MNKVRFDYSLLIILGVSIGTVLVALGIGEFVSEQPDILLNIYALFWWIAFFTAIFSILAFPFLVYFAKKKKKSALPSVLTLGVGALFIILFFIMPAVLTMRQRAEHEMKIEYNDTSWAKWNQHAGKFDLELGAQMGFDSFSTDGLAPVSYQGKYGYIDKMGDIIIDLKYDKAYMFRDGKAKVVLYGETFYINHEGEKLEQPK